MKIFAVGMNYASHNKEMLHTLQLTDPVIFTKAESALLKDGKPFFIPDFSEDLQYETEIVVKITKLGKNIAERFASRYYSEATVGIDFTARDLQQKLREKGLPWDICKGFDQSAAVGKFIPLSELGNIQSVPFRLEINGQRVQEGNTALMIHSIDRIVSYISRFFTLKTGDLIYTGTPAGVGQVHVNDHLEGYINEAKLMDFYVK